MSAHLSRLRLFQRHLRSLVWVGVWVWDWIHSHTPPRPRSPSSRPPPFTHYPVPPRSLVCGGQPSPQKPRLVVSHSTCPPLSSFPHVHSFVLGPAVINNNSLHRDEPNSLLNHSQFIAIRPTDLSVSRSESLLGIMVLHNGPINGGSRAPSKSLLNRSKPERLLTMFNLLAVRQGCTAKTVGAQRFTIVL